jgi:hypothetical protein
MTSLRPVGRRPAWSALVIAALAFAALLPGAGYADATVATTSPATSVSSTLATLNGTVNAGTIETAWRFQYGTTTAYGNLTPVKVIPTGTQTVSATISGLTRGATYHFRLVAAQGSYPTHFFTGSDLTFTASTSVATTSRATSVTDNSATLNGVINTGGLQTGWRFQYGTSTAYGKLTLIGSVASGARAVSARITGLKHGTRYHFRLVAVHGTSPPQYFIGRDLTLVTGGNFGIASLVSRQLAVHHGIVSVPMHCAGSGGALCTGKITLTALERLGNHTHKVGCGSGTFIASAGRTHAVKSAIGNGCQALLGAASNHQLGATLAASFSSHQRPLHVPVTLTG